MGRTASAASFWPQLLPLIVTVALGTRANLPVARAEPPPFTHRGEPFFPIGLWSNPPGGGFTARREELGAAGFNVIHRWYSHVTRASLDADYACGLNVISWAYAWLSNPYAYQTAIENKIAEIGDHPGFFAWDTRDEPYWNYSRNPTGVTYTREGLTTGKEFFNARDPAHPVMCNFAPYDLVVGQGDPPITLEGFQQWTSVANFFTTDRYPADGHYPNTNLRPVAYCCDQLQLIAGPGVPLMIILQGCGLGEWGGTPNPASRPNLIEDRFLVYSAIIHGMKGVLYYGTNHIEPDSQMWADLKTVVGELRSLHDVLCRGKTSTHYTVQTQPCEAIMKLHEGYRFLIVDNPGTSPRNRVTISVPGWHSPSVEVFFENRSIQTTLGSFSDDFAPWDSHVYKIPFQTVWTDLGDTDLDHDLMRLSAGVPDGDTESASIGGREARRNLDPAEDRYFYFDASDAFAYAGSRHELYVTIDYYDSGSGSLGLEYDSDTGQDVAARYKSGGTVPLSGSNEWKQHLFHVTDAWFGNRQNGGADFRIAGYGDGVFYLDVVGVSTESPVPDPVLQGIPQPGNLTVDRDADLSWKAPDRATSYRVYFGTTDPPSFQAEQSGITFDPGTMAYHTRYYWQVDAVNGFGLTAGEVWSFVSEPFPGDSDADGDVDQEDFGRFQVCYSGMGTLHTPACAKWDLDGDGDVDRDDFSVFQACLSGPGRRPVCE